MPTTGRLSMECRQTRRSERRRSVEHAYLVLRPIERALRVASGKAACPWRLRVEGEPEGCVLGARANDRVAAAAERRGCGCTSPRDHRCLGLEVLAVGPTLFGSIAGVCKDFRWSVRRATDHVRRLMPTRADETWSTARGCCFMRGVGPRGTLHPTTNKRRHQLTVDRCAHMGCTSHSGQ